MVDSLMFGAAPRLAAREASQVPVRLLAHLGDAVFSLFERERQVLAATSVKQLHVTTTKRTSAAGQAAILAALVEHLAPSELDLIKRARNVKVQGPRRANQNIYRQSTAFEALIGYLYLCDTDRLALVLALATDSDCQQQPAES